MPKKSVNSKTASNDLDRSNNNDDLWVNPRSNIRGPDGNRAWDMSGNITPDNGARFLELADLALGLKKPAQAKKKAAAAGLRSLGKEEPYSQR